MQKLVEHVSNVLLQFHNVQLISKVLRSHQPVAAVSSTSTTISSDDGPVRKTNKKAEKDSSKEPTHIRFSDDSDSDSTTT